MRGSGLCVTLRPVKCRARDKVQYKDLTCDSMPAYRVQRMPWDQ